MIRILDLDKLNEMSILINWHQTKFCLVSNPWENCKYNSNFCLILQESEIDLLFVYFDTKLQRAIPHSVILAVVGIRIPGTFRPGIFPQGMFSPDVVPVCSSLRSH